MKARQSPAWSPLLGISQVFGDPSGPLSAPASCLRAVAVHLRPSMGRSERCANAADGEFHSHRTRFAKHQMCKEWPHRRVDGLISLQPWPYRQRWPSACTRRHGRRSRPCQNASFRIVRKLVAHCRLRRSSRSADDGLPSNVMATRPGDRTARSNHPIASSIQRSQLAGSASALARQAAACAKHASLRSTTPYLTGRW